MHVWRGGQVGVGVHGARSSFAGVVPVSGNTQRRCVPTPAALQLVIEQDARVGSFKAELVQKQEGHLVRRPKGCVERW